MIPANSSSLSTAGLVADRLCTMFYCVDPTLHLHEKAEDVPDYVGGAVPMFIALIVLEAIAITVMGRRQHLFNLKESLCSISLGLLQLAIEGAGFTFMLKNMYPWVYDNLRLSTVPYDSALCWAALVLGVDVCYYWMHRCSHEFHYGWVGHSVHHSGEYYNLATALRQGVGQSFVGPFFYLPLALLGLPQSMLLAHKSFNVLYQFWIHTELVGSLGPLEYVLNTPSHHRMHHRPGGNCNYAGVLIIWDRIFGSFRAEESRKDLYGLGGQIFTYDPVLVNTDHPRKLFASTADAGPAVWLKKLCGRRLPARWVFRPSALFEPIPAPKENLWRVPTQPARAKFEGGAYRGAAEAAYLVVHLGVLVLFMFSPAWKREGWAVCVLGVGWICFSLSCLGQLADAADAADALEAGRALLFGCLLWQQQMPALSPLPLLDAATTPEVVRVVACCLPPLCFVAAAAARSGGAKAAPPAKKVQ